jgi:hypothetical protein
MKQKRTHFNVPCALCVIEAQLMNKPFSVAAAAAAASLFTVW